MNSCQHPKQLYESWKMLQAFMLANGDNIQTDENMKKFEEILIKSSPDWNDPVQVAIYYQWHSISDKTQTDEGFVDPDRDRKIIRLLQHTKNECLIMWCRPRVITNWFNIRGAIFIKWDDSNHQYRVIKNNPRTSSYGFNYGRDRYNNVLGRGRRGGRRGRGRGRSGRGRGRSGRGRDRSGDRGSRYESDPRNIHVNYPGVQLEQEPLNKVNKLEEPQPDVQPKTYHISETVCNSVFETSSDDEENKSEEIPPGESDSEQVTEINSPQDNTPVRDETNEISNAQNKC